mmetsp:Transcript_23624/g.30771  ORF Transcript_23624/g.30771 Transcript_23624/m.30771 type:complete len:334 (+) Transcript_23624:65-1066(+)
MSTVKLSIFYIFFLSLARVSGFRHLKLRSQSVFLNRNPRKCYMSTYRQTPPSLVPLKASIYSDLTRGDNEALSNVNSDSKEAKRITFIGSVANIALMVVKYIVGKKSGSLAMIADAGHSFSDLIADAITLTTIHLSQRSKMRIPQNHIITKNVKNHEIPYESFGCLAISLFLIYASINLVSDSFKVLVSNSFINGDILSIQSIRTTMSLNHIKSFKSLKIWSTMISFPMFKTWTSKQSLPLLVSLLGLLVKEELFQLTANVAKKINSQVLLANAWHHRSDALASLVALIGIIGSCFGFSLLDPIAAMIVALILAINGLTVGWDAIKGLLVDYC